MRNIKTDKIAHGYLQVYHPLFLSLESVNNVLEIGVYNGDSLRLFCVNASGTYSNYYIVNSTTPMTWTTNDNFTIRATYEAV